MKGRFRGHQMANNLINVFIVNRFLFYNEMYSKLVQ